MESNTSKNNKRTTRWGDNDSQQQPASNAAKAAALQASIRERLARLKRKKGLESTTPPPPPPPNDEPLKDEQPVVKKAKVYDLDMSVTAPQREDKAAPKKNPYLPSSNENEEEEEDALLLDSRLAGGQVSKTRQHHKPLKFVEPGKFIELAEKKRRKALNAEKSGFVSGRKEGLYVKSVGLAGVYGQGIAGEALEEKLLPPRADCEGTQAPCAMEWWDVELLPGKLKKEVGAKEGKILQRNAKRRMELRHSANQQQQDEVNLPQLTAKCYTAAALQNSKTAALVQHPVPVKPPQAQHLKPPKQPTLYLTKKEMKRQRKLRRMEKLRELQDLQAVGVIPPPEPRLTLANFIKVLGDQAITDPSKMEQKVMEQIQSRKIKHEKMNEERKLTPAQRRIKKIKKMAEDTSQCVSVALFVVQDMSHRYHRTKVDLNAMQNKITGGVLECESGPKLALVIAEGGPKAVNRFIRLMTVRMKWRGEQFTGDGSEEEKDATQSETTELQKFNPNNLCELIWQGMAVKRKFNSFVFQSCPNSESARKILQTKGVAHYWDQVLVHAAGRAESFTFTLGNKVGDQDSQEEDEVVFLEKMDQNDDDHKMEVDEDEDEDVNMKSS